MGAWILPTGGRHSFQLVRVRRACSYVLFFLCTAVFHLLVALSAHRSFFDIYAIGVVRFVLNTSKRKATVSALLSDQMQ
jgi:hypothetical protein